MTILDIKNKLKALDTTSFKLLNGQLVRVLFYMTKVGKMSKQTPNFIYIITPSKHQFYTYKLI